MIGDLRLSDAQVRALLDAYQRPDFEVVCEPTTKWRLHGSGLVRVVATWGQGSMVMLTEKAQDLVWGWHNPMEVR